MTEEMIGDFNSFYESCRARIKVRQRTKQRCCQGIPKNGDELSKSLTPLGVTQFEAWRWDL
jgi:hypothetical protein